MVLSKMFRASLFAPAIIWCSIIAQAQFLFGSAFQPSSRVSKRTLHKPTTRASSTTEFHLLPEIHESMQNLSTSPPVSAATSILLSSEAEVESWRQYVPLVVSSAVIIDILLGSPLANMALAPMKRASEQGAMGDSAQGSDGDDGDGGGASLFSASGGNTKVNSGRGKERVDSAAIAQAALDKAYGTMELKRFLEENKTDEQRYEDVRKKLDQQMQELDEE